mgnify:CR=1 FL=1
MKFNLFHHEQTDKFKAQINKIDNLFYNQKQNCFYCPMGQKMTQIGTFTKKTDNQFQQTITKYQAQNCVGCPLRGACHKQAGNRKIEVNMNLRLNKEKIREKSKTKLFYVLENIIRNSIPLIGSIAYISDVLHANWGCIES